MPSRNLCVRVDEGLYRLLREQAEAEGLTVSEAARRAIAQYLRRRARRPAEPAVAAPVEAVHSSPRIRVYLFRLQPRR